MNVMKATKRYINTVLTALLASVVKLDMIWLVIHMVTLTEKDLYEALMHVTFGKEQKQVNINIVNLLFGFLTNS